MFSIQLLTYCTILNLQVSSLQSVLFVVLVALRFYEAHRPLSYPIFQSAIFKNLRGFTAIVVGVLFLGNNYSSTAILWPPQGNTLYTQEPVSFAWYIGAIGIA